MTEQHDDSNIAWGVDFSGPPPQRRATWGQPAEGSAPARRADAAGTDTTAIPTPSWAPIAFDPAQETGDDSDVIDVAVLEPPSHAPDELAAPVAAFEHNPAFTSPAAPVADAPALGDAFDLFADEPAPAQAHPDPEDDAQAQAAPQPQEPADQAAETAMTAAAPQHELTHVPDPAPVPTQAPDAEPAPEVSQAPAQAAVPPAEFHLPAVVLPTADAAVVAEPVQDLTDVFGTPSPAPVPATAVVTASGTDFASRKAALEAARAASEAQVSAPVTATNDTLSARYLNSERYYDSVDRLLALGQSGDPLIQGMLRGFVLTRDKDIDADQRRAYQDAMLPLMQANYLQFDAPGDYEPIFDMAYDELIGIGPLGPLWRDDNVTEIMVSGPDKVTVERDGKLQMTPVKFRDAGHLERTARDLSQRVDDRAVSRNNPLVTAQLPGARVQFVMKPVAATAGTLIVIRKFRELFGMDDLLKFDSLDERMAAFLCDAISSRATVLISGGTGSGKTTMINALSSFIPDTERVVTIEDALELQLTNTHVESLLTKESASGDDQLIIGQADLLRATLRMRPDRIIVGEIRDGRGCSVMLQAANTGHDGTMTTVHANTPEMAIERMADLLREEKPLPDDVAKNQVTSAINLVVQIVKKRGRRYVSAISAVSNERTTDGHRQLTVPLFAGEFPTTSRGPIFAQVGSLGSDTELAQKMLDAGYDPTQWEMTT